MPVKCPAAIDAHTAVMPDSFWEWCMWQRNNKQVQECQDEGQLEPRCFSVAVQQLGWKKRRVRPALCDNLQGADTFGGSRVNLYVFTPVCLHRLVFEPVCMCGRFLPSFPPFLCRLILIWWCYPMSSQISNIAQIYPRGVLTPCYQSSCRAASPVSSLHDILLGDRGTQDEERKRKMEAAFSVCTGERVTRRREREMGAASHSHLQGTHLAFPRCLEGFRRLASFSITVCLPISCLCAVSLPNWPLLLFILLNLLLASSDI